MIRVCRLSTNSDHNTTQFTEISKCLLISLLSFDIKLNLIAQYCNTTLVKKKNKKSKKKKTQKKKTQNRAQNRALKF